jgi:hypothetical protein
MKEKIELISLEIKDCLRIHAQATYHNIERIMLLLLLLLTFQLIAEGCRLMQSRL